MSVCCCHRANEPPAKPASAEPPSTKPLSIKPLSIKPQRGRDIAAGAGSLALWLLTPKCPVCLAAYVALWTGLGLSFTEAACLRWALLSASAMLLLYVGAKRDVHRRAFRVFCKLAARR